MDPVRQRHFDLVHSRDWASLGHLLRESTDQQAIAGALRFAVQYDVVEVIPLYRDAGVSLDIVDSTGLTALMWASQWGRSRPVEALLGHGADPNAVDPDGWNALFHATRSQRLEIVKLLLAGGVYLSHRSHTGLSVLDVARLPLVRVESDGRVRQFSNAAVTKYLERAHAQRTR